jgi:OmpA-OmpF porin, OOP family
MKLVRWIAAVMLAATTAAAPAFVVAADEPSWYGGIGLGRGEVARPGSWAERTDLSLFTQGVTSVTTISTGNTAWKLFGGYQMNENFGVEAGYARLGKFGGISTVTAPAAGTGSGTWDASAFSVSAVGTLPIHENRVSAIGKLGLAYTRLDVNETAPRGATTVALNPSNDRANLVLGIGLRFDLTKTVGLRAEWEHYSNVGDGTSTGQSAVDVWSLNAVFRF